MTDLLISIIVPTYNEAGSVPSLAERLASSLAGRRWELVIVDDRSPDGTGDLAQALAPRIPVRVVRRSRKAGLASAVLAGVAQARGNVLVIMDADLSHPPEVVPALVDAVEAGADLAVGSRYVAGGGIVDWPLRRRVVSRVAGILGSVLVPVSDATSGFFAMRRQVIEGVRLNPIGFKIGFEVMARGHHQRVSEVPYVFRDRRFGSSKFGRREIVQYLVQLTQVARDRALRRI